MVNLVQFSFVNIRSTLVFTGFPLSVSAMLALGSVMGGVMIAGSPLASTGWFPIWRQQVAKLKWNFWTSNLIWVCLHVSKLPTPKVTWKWLIAAENPQNSGTQPFGIPHTFQRKHPRRWDDNFETFHQKILTPQTIMVARQRDYKIFQLSIPLWFGI